ncbi:Merozoite surface protein 1 [Frankliniella fusca]|uniref:Merozoite surface protein 1 n=1 Tax=Frankliniella fusca TaxID=407009 RepID=A0AAE1HDW4_9NEOP|nr:Merozoite surface protein 1 [Frankliniella fusca]
MFCFSSSFVKGTTNSLLNATPLTPLSTQNTLPMSSNLNHTASPLQLGSTWSNAGLNIDVDNLTLSGNRNKSGTGPSMNQLATNSPTSPLARQGLTSTFTNMMPMAQSGTTGPIMGVGGGLMGSMPSSVPAPAQSPMLSGLPVRIPSMPGTIPGAMPGALPGTMPGTMPGAMTASSMPGAIPTSSPMSGMAPLGMMQSNSTSSNSAFFPATFK